MKYIFAFLCSAVVYLGRNSTTDPALKRLCMGKFQIYGASYSSGMSNKVKQASAKMYMFQKFNILRVKRIMVNEKTVKDACHLYLDS